MPAQQKEETVRVFPLRTPEMRACALLISVTFLLASDAQARTKVLADDIAVPASSLPEFKNDPHVKESQGNQISGVVRTILQDAGGSLWFGTQNGLSRYDGTALVYFDLKDELGQGITVTAIAEDRDGNIWIGSTGGLTRYDG